MSILIYILVGSVFFGTQILDLNLGIAKLSIYRLMIGILGILFLILIKKNDSRIEFYRNKLSDYYVGYYILWFIYAIVSIVWIQNIVGWLKAVFFIGTGVLAILFITTFIKSKREILNLYHTIFVMISMHNLIGWYELITGDYLFANLNKLDKYGTFESQPLTRIPISIYANQNDYATMLTLGFFVLLILFIYIKNKYMKIAYFMVMLSTIYLVFRTQSRANLIGLFLGLAVIVLIQLGPILKELLMTKVVRRMVFFIGILGVFSLFLMEPVQQLILNIFTNNQYSVANVSSSNYNRIYLLLNGMKFLLTTLGLGVGAGNIEYWMANYATYPTSGIVNIHNWWAEILVGYGSIIFSMYVLMYITMFIKLYKQYQKTNNNFIKASSIGFIGFIGAFIISSISSSSMMTAEWQWVLWGCIIVFIKYCEKSELSSVSYYP